MDDLLRITIYTLSQHCEEHKHIDIQMASKGLNFHELNPML